ncbi:MAG: LysM peptidoglycan-binding domain-containing protein [Chloroflexota bacterium]
MPAFRTLVPAACLALVLAATPILGASALAADEVVVKAGDTLSAISKRHGVAISTLVSINGLVDPNRIFVGQRLQLGSPTAPAPATPPPPVAAPAEALVHVVARGDNLWSIARFYGVSLSALVSANGIGNASRIHAGLRLTIPGAAAPVALPAPPPAPAAPPNAPPAAPPPTTVAPAPVQALVHTVARGDNLWSIARFYGVSLSALVSANGISNASRIHPGLELTIPGAAAPVAAPAPAPAPAPAAPAMPAGMAAVVAARDGMRQLIAEEATAAGVPVALALAVAWQESGWRQDVVSSAGAVGVMQLMPGTAQWVGQAMLGRTVNINDARDNVHAGVRLLAHYVNRYGGNRDLVLAAYYQGQGATDRHGVFPVSRAYIAAVDALVRLLGG